MITAGTDITDDLLGAGQAEAVQRIAGLYLGDFTHRLQLARDDYTAAVRRATMQPGLPAGISVPETSKLVSTMYGWYAWERVTADRVESQLGGAVVKDLLTTDPTNPVIAALAAGIAIRVGDWEQVYAAAMEIAANKRRQQNAADSGGSDFSGSR